MSDSAQPVPPSSRNGASQAHDQRSAPGPDDATNPGPADATRRDTVADAIRRQVAETRDPRERLLLAGYLLLAENGHRALEAGLNPDTISRSAGRSRRSFYDYFENKQQFLDALYERFVTFDAGHHPSDDMLGILDTLMRESEGDMVRALSVIGQLYDDADNPSAARHVQLIAAVLSSGHERDSIVAESYRQSSDLYVRVYERLIDEWGFRLRPPWTTERVAMVLRAVGDGLALRRRIDPSAVDNGLFRDTLLTVFPTLVEFADQPSTSVVESVEAIAVEAQSRWSERRNPSSVVNARQQVTAAMNELLGRVGYRTITIDLLSAHSQVSQQTILRSMGTVDDILCGLFSDYVVGLESQFERDAANSTIDDRILLDLHLERLGKLAVEQRPIVRALSVIALDQELSPAHVVYYEAGRVTQRAIDAVAAAIPAADDSRAEVLSLLAPMLVNIIVSNAALALSDPGHQARVVAQAILGTPEL